jgi:hypothetical protein
MEPSATGQQVEPGLVTVPEWRPEAGTQQGTEVIPLYAVVARKP